MTERAIITESALELALASNCEDTAALETAEGRLLALVELEATAVHAAILESINTVRVMHLIGPPLAVVDVSIRELHSALAFAQTIFNLALVHIASVECQLANGFPRLDTDVVAIAATDTL